MHCLLKAQDIIEVAWFAVTAATWHRKYIWVLTTLLLVDMPRLELRHCLEVCALAQTCELHWLLSGSTPLAQHSRPWHSHLHKQTTQRTVDMCSLLPHFEHLNCLCSFESCREMRHTYLTTWQRLGNTTTA